MTVSPAAPRSGFDRAAIFVVPAAAGLAVALTLLGAGRERPALGARVYGLPVAASSAWALRVETVASERNMLTTAREVPFAVELRCGGRSARSSGRSGPAGIAELTLRLAGASATPASSCELDVMGADGSIARGSVVPAPPLRPAALPPLDGSVDGPLTLQVSLPRGVAVAALEERVEVVARLPPSPSEPSANPCETGSPAPTTAEGAAAVALELRARGARLLERSPPGRWRCVEGRPSLGWSTAFVAEAPPVELEVVARSPDGGQSTWRGELPVVLGRAWASERAAAGGRLLVRSVARAPHIFASVVGPAGRLWGDVLVLEPDGEGFTAVERPLPALPAGPLVLCLASDPAEPHETSARWPLRPAVGSLEGAELRRLLDGLPDALERERQRQRRARMPAAALVVAAGLFELSYLLRRQRQSRQRALETLGSLTRSRAARARLVAEFGLLWLGVLGGGVALAFVALGALALWG